MTIPLEQGALPGEEMVRQGLTDLDRGEVSDYSLLLLIAAPRLKALGVQVPESELPRPREHMLYARLEERLGPGAHSHYNSLLRRVASYAHALEREQGASENSQSNI